VIENDGAEYGVKEEEFLGEGALDLLSMLVENVTAPHAKDFPPPELMKETLSTDLLIVVAFDKPVSECDIVDWLIMLIRGNPLPTQRIELLQLRCLQLQTLLRYSLPMLLVLCTRHRLYIHHWLQVIWIIRLWAWFQVDEVAIIFSLTL